MKQYSKAWWEDVRTSENGMWTYKQLVRWLMEPIKISGLIIPSTRVCEVGRGRKCSVVRGRRLSEGWRRGRFVESHSRPATFDLRPITSSDVDLGLPLHGVIARQSVPPFLPSHKYHTTIRAIFNRVPGKILHLPLFNSRKQKWNIFRNLPRFLI